MIRSAWFPDSKHPPEWGERLVDLFRRHEKEISSDSKPPLSSSQVLQLISDDLRGAGFVIERRAPPADAQAPAAFDVFHPEWMCCLAIAAPGEAGGAAALVEPLLVVDVDTFCLALPNVVDAEHRRPEVPDFEGACELALTVYGHSRVKLPYRMLLVGY